MQVDGLSELVVAWDGIYFSTKPCRRTVVEITPRRTERRRACCSIPSNFFKQLDGTPVHGRGGAFPRRPRKHGAHLQYLDIMATNLRRTKRMGESRTRTRRRRTPNDGRRRGVIEHILCLHAPFPTLRNRGVFRPNLPAQHLSPRWWQQGIQDAHAEYVRVLS